MTAPYDPFPFLAALMSSPEGRLLLGRLLGEAGITQEKLEAAVAAAGPPKPPTHG